MRTTRPLSSAGFSLVEVLVALAILSCLLLGIGSLTGSVVGLTVRAAEAEAILNALIEIDGVALSIGRVATTQLIETTADGFELEPAAMLALRQAAGSTLLELDHPSATVRIELSIFDAVSLEYLDPAGSKLWSALPADAARIVGVRLVLAYGARVWRPLLWLRDRYRA